MEVSGRGWQASRRWGRCFNLLPAAFKWRFTFFLAQNMVVSRRRQMARQQQSFSPSEHRSREPALPSAPPPPWKPLPAVPPPRPSRRPAQAAPVWSLRLPLCL